MAKHSKLTLVSAIALALSACAVGPDYQRPDTPFVEASFAQADQYSSEAAQGALWEALGDADLQQLIERARRENRDLALALARLNEVRALRGLTVYSLFPTVTAGADAERNKPSGRDPNLPPDVAQTNDSYRVGFDAIWEIDLFGSLKRQSEAIYRDTEAARARLADTQRMVEAEVAQAYVALRGTQARLKVQRRNVANLQENIDLLERMLEAGRGTELDVSRQRALGLAVAASLPALEAEVARQEQRLAVLTAQSVQALRASIAAEAPLPMRTDLVAVGTPGEWLRRRPDVNAAERDLAAATARIGVEVAELYPKLNLTGAFGWTAASAGDLFEGDSERWRFGPVLSWNFLDYGRVKRRIHAAEARADQALATFEQTVLRALEETENALAGYRAAQQSALILAEASAQADHALELARARLEAGASDYLVVLDAERTALDLRDQSLTAATNRATALVALYKALAGDFVEVPQDDRILPEDWSMESSGRHGTH